MKVLLPILRRVSENSLADLLSVQSMTGPVAQIHALRVRYADEPPVKITLRDGIYDILSVADEPILEEIQNWLSDTLDRTFDFQKEQLPTQSRVVMLRFKPRTDQEAVLFHMRWDDLIVDGT